MMELPPVSLFSKFGLSIETEGMMVELSIMERPQDREGMIGGEENRALIVLDDTPSSGLVLR